MKLKQEIKKVIVETLTEARKPQPYKSNKRLGITKQEYEIIELAKLIDDSKKTLDGLKDEKQTPDVVSSIKAVEKSIKGYENKLRKLRGEPALPPEETDNQKRIRELEDQLRKMLGS
jgi:hypothetical protein